MANGLKTLVILVCCAALPMDLAAQEITRGPFLQQLSHNRIVVVWETDGSTDGRVEYGLDANYGQSVSSSSGDHHEVPLTGLTPSTTYHYKVVSGSVESPDGVFATAPDGPEPFRFVVFGDNRDDDGDHSNHEALMPAILAEGPEFVVNTGDMVDVGLSSDMWDRFFEIERDMLRDIPMWPTFGNHEQWDFANRTYLAIFALPDSAGSEHRYYDFRYSNSHFIVMNTHDILYGTYLTTAQKDFVQGSLAAAANDPSVRHIFLVGHHGPYSSSNHGGSATVRSFVEGLDQVGQVDYFFAGHDHCYERWEAGSGLKGFVAGGGGAGLYGQDDPGASYSRFFARAYHYLLVEVSGDWVRVCPRHHDGSAVEPCIETGNQPECTAPGDCEGLDHDPCPGNWTCPNGTCLWVCDAEEPDGGHDGGTDGGPDGSTDAGGDETTEDAGTDGEDAQPADTGSDAGSDPGADPGTDAGTDAGSDPGSADEDPGTDDITPADEDEPAAGCGCATPAKPANGTALVLLALVLVLRRRR